MAEQAQDFSQPRREAQDVHVSSWIRDPDGPPLKVGAARWLAWVLHQERPDWAPQDIMAALEEVREEPPGNTYRAALYAALEPTADPSVIGQAGPHWEAVRMRAPRPQAPAPPGPTKVHRPRSRMVDGQLKPSWREDPSIQEARMKARPAGAPVFGEDRLV